MRGEALCGSAPLRAKMKFIPLASLAPWRDANTSLLATQVPLRARDELRKDDHSYDRTAPRERRPFIFSFATSLRALRLCVMLHFFLTKNSPTVTTTTSAEIPTAHGFIFRDLADIV